MRKLSVLLVSLLLLFVSGCFHVFHADRRPAPPPRHHVDKRPAPPPPHRHDVDRRPAPAPNYYIDVRPAPPPPRR